MIIPLIVLMAAQVPMTPGKAVTLTWTPASCGPTPCGYFVSRIKLSAGTTKCPAAAAGNYTPLNYGDPTEATNFVDPTSSGLTVCYVVQTEVGNVPSKPSAPAGPFVVK